MGLFFKKPKASGRHTHYYQVRESLARKGCALCRLSLDSVARQLDGLAYEEVNDPGLRERLRASRGFCPHHAWQLAHLRSSGLGVALIYRDVLGEVARILEGVRVPTGGPLSAYRRKPSLPSRLLPQAPCPICSNLAETEARYLGTFLDHLPEPDFADAYRAAEGLCLPHLDRALHCRPAPETRAILLQTASGSLRSAPESCRPGDPKDKAGLVELLSGARGALIPGAVPALSAKAAGKAKEGFAPEGLISALGGEGCPVCLQALEAGDRVRREEVEVEWTRALGGAMRQPEVQAAFRRSVGLCLPHLVQTLQGTDQAGAHALAALQSERIGKMVAELSEYIRKQDYRFQEEPWGTEATSPRRAVSLMVGVEALRGVGGIWWPERG